METFVLTGAEKSRLRGRGQQMDPAVKLGKEGLTPALIAELKRQFKGHDLVKVRFVGSDRVERAALCVQLAAATASTCVGAVGATALFYTPRPAPIPVPAPAAQPARAPRPARRG
jgi:RNA-binding protein